jgi:hypothetical protein
MDGDLLPGGMGGVDDRLQLAARDRLIAGQIVGASGGGINLHPIGA